MLDELDDDDREGPTTLPRACLLKALKDVAPDVKFSNDSREFISLCSRLVFRGGKAAEDPYYRSKAKVTS